MASRTLHITNNSGESVRVEVIYRDTSVDNITVDDNTTRSLEIKEPLFVDLDHCRVRMLVYKLGEDTPKEERIIESGQNEVNVIIKKGNTGPAIFLAE